MTCCAPGLGGHDDGVLLRRNGAIDDSALITASRPLERGVLQIDLSVPDVNCGVCINTLERELGALEMVEGARVNLTAKRVRVRYRPDLGPPGTLLDVISKAGYRVFLPSEIAPEGDDRLKLLLRSLAVAGFAAANIMLFSVSVWSGADAATRQLFHWISALIAIVAVAYAGRVFFSSALGVLRAGRLNMDVPISVGVLLATGLSLYETATGGRDAYFDAATMLLFFLLAGRTLDHVMRERARGVVRNLARLQPQQTYVRGADGSLGLVDAAALEAGMMIELRPGERLAADGELVSGGGHVDNSLVTGEAVPVHVHPGDVLTAGTISLSEKLLVRAIRPAAESFLARMVDLVSAAEGARSGYRRIADRAAAIYAPLVHVLGLATFAGWFAWSGDWHLALTNGISVLIITCPCALALAVPIVHVVAAGRLYGNGVVMRDGAALERLAGADHAVFDKTGTLTQGRPAFKGQFFGERDFDGVATRLGALSAHPLARALVLALARLPADRAPFGPDVSVSEVAGRGVEVREGPDVWRLGQAEWCGSKAGAAGKEQSEVWLSRNGVAVAGFGFADTVRPEAPFVVSSLLRSGLAVSVLSGDRPGPVAAAARACGIESFAAQQTPEDKLGHLQLLADGGARVLMVGDGINDAPALRAAHVSMAPASASEIGRSAADLIYLNDDLASVPFALLIARRAARLVRENFALAIAYNLVAIPLAISGQVTPLIAAVAMSSSSVLVILNAMRLRFGTVQNFDAVKRPADGPGVEGVERVAAA